MPGGSQTMHLTAPLYSLFAGEPSTERARATSMLTTPPSASELLDPTGSTSTVSPPPPPPLPPFSSLPRLLSFPTSHVSESIPRRIMALILL